MELQPLLGWLLFNVVASLTAPETFNSENGGYLPPTNEFQKPQVGYNYDPPKGVPLLTYGPPEKDSEEESNSIKDAYSEFEEFRREWETQRQNGGAAPSNTYVTPQPSSSYQAPVKATEKPTSLYEPPKQTVPKPPQTLYHVPLEGDDAEEVEESYQPPTVYGPPKQTYKAPAATTTTRRPQFYRPPETSKAILQTILATDDSDEDEEKSVYFKIPEVAYQAPPSKPNTLYAPPPSEPETLYKPPSIPSTTHPTPRPVYGPPTTPPSPKPVYRPPKTPSKPRPVYGPPTTPPPRRPVYGPPTIPSTPKPAYVPPKVEQTYLPPSRSTAPKISAEPKASMSHNFFKIPHVSSVKTTQSYQPPKQEYSAPVINNVDDHDSDEEESYNQPPQQLYSAPDSEEEASYQPPQQTYSPPKSPPNTNSFFKLPSQDAPKTYQPPKPTQSYKAPEPPQLYELPKTTPPPQAYRPPAVQQTYIPPQPQQTPEPPKIYKAPPSIPSTKVQTPSKTFAKPKKPKISKQPPKTYKIPEPPQKPSYKPPPQEDLQSVFIKQDTNEVSQGYAAPAASKAKTMKAMAMPFVYEWEVKDDESGNFFGHSADSDGMVVNGKYHVVLPDGRTQIVTYLADWDTGYHVNVEYKDAPEAAASGGYN